MGSSCLRTLTQEYGLNTENVENIMDDLREAMEEHKSVEDSLSKGFQELNETDVDDNELASELDKLELEMKNDSERSMMEKLQKLPDVPQTTVVNQRKTPIREAQQI
jgi:hypothetical protein